MFHRRSCVYRMLQGFRARWARSLPPSRHTLTNPRTPTRTNPRTRWRKLRPLCLPSLRRMQPRLLLKPRINLHLTASQLHHRWNQWKLHRMCWRIYFDRVSWVCGIDCQLYDLLGWRAVWSVWLRVLGHCRWTMWCSSGGMFGCYSCRSMHIMWIRLYSQPRTVRKHAR